MPLLSPFAPTVLFLVALLVYIGLAHRVLDGMRLNRRIAGLLVLLMGLGTFTPELPLAPGVSVDPGGALIPLGVAAYLVAGADRPAERRRAVVAALATGALVYLADVLLPLEPFGRVDLDPVYLPGLVAGLIAYLLGRSRRAAFVAGVGGVILADLLAVAVNAATGVPGALVAVGGAGLVDAVVMAGVIAVLLAEAIGEGREWLAGRRRPASGAGGPERDREQLLDDSLLSVGVLLVSVAAVALGGYFHAALPPPPGGELAPGAHLTVVDPAGQELTQIGRRLQVDDLYVSGAGIVWRVVEVTARHAVVEAAQRVDGGDAGEAAAVWAGPGELRAELELGDIFPILEDPLGEVDEPEGDQLPPLVPAAPRLPGPIGVYHTHNAESYIIGDGTSSINGVGGIHRVGSAFTATLAEQGFEVIFDESLHLPHDRGAYRRSRRTVAQLLREQPVALFDIHRDATPPEVYFHRLEDGTEVTRVRLVVGTQHVNYERNMVFARALKQLAETIYPGLVLDIFVISGAHFNQDVGRHSLLLEVGAHTNARAHAEEGARRFAEVVAAYFHPDLP